MISCCQPFCSGRKSSRIRRISYASAVVWSCFVGFSPGVSQVATPSSQALAPEGYVDLDGIWAYPGNVPVCWESAAEPYAMEKGWVQSAVKEHIADVSSLTFRDWIDCTPELVGVRIRIADEGPKSDVGIQWERDTNGTRRQDGFGRWIQKPTRMVLNFTFGFHPAFRNQCTDNSNPIESERKREHCIRALGVHEFLHAVGFLHEHIRPDTPTKCKERFAGLVDFQGFRPERAQDYDPDSHVNYCTSMYREPIKLSAGDLLVLRKFYPKA